MKYKEMRRSGFLSLIFYAASAIGLFAWVYAVANHSFAKAQAGDWLQFSGGLIGIVGAVVGTVYVQNDAKFDRGLRRWKTIGAMGKELQSRMTTLISSARMYLHGGQSHGKFTDLIVEIEAIADFAKALREEIGMDGPQSWFALRLMEGVIAREHPKLSIALEQIDRLILLRHDSIFNGDAHRGEKIFHSIVGHLEDVIDSVTLIAERVPAIYADFE